MAVVFESTKRWLYAQEIMWPPAVVALLGVGGHALWTSPLVALAGYDGAALSLLCAHSTMCLLLLIWVAVLRPHEPATWPTLRLWRRALSEWRPMREFLGTTLAAFATLSEWVYW